VQFAVNDEWQVPVPDVNVMNCLLCVSLLVGDAVEVTSSLLARLRHCLPMMTGLSLLRC
jgi:hypothetical protein